MSILEGSRIFNPQAKVVANLERVLEFFETGNTSPILVEIDPSNSCNHGCAFCISSYIHFREYKGTATFDRSIMPENKLLELCRDLVDLGVKAVNWTGGGEPTINPALGKAVRLIGETSEIKMGIFTNGTLMDRFDLFETFARYLTWVRFSIDSGKPETYNHIRQTHPGTDWNKMMSNLNALIAAKKRIGSNLKIGVGYVISPDNYLEITDFARTFANIDVDYCQYKPEIVNREREDGIQRNIEFWQNMAQPIKDAKNILGAKFQMNEYKLSDLENDPEHYGRTYKKCLGSQVQPCIGADGHVYVCTNHRGYKEYSYGSIYERSFHEIWHDLEARNRIMHKINDIDKFCNCTKLCKPHESNKMMWHIHENLENPAEIQRLKRLKEKLLLEIEHIEFI